MLIVASIYIGVIWLVFFQFKLLPWNCYWGTFTSLLGLFILATVVGLVNYLTPSGRITVQGEVVEVTPSHQGKVYQKDFGEDSDVIASGMVIYNPDSTWSEAR